MHIRFGSYGMIAEVRSGTAVWRFSSYPGRGRGPRALKLLQLFVRYIRFTNPSLKANRISWFASDDMHIFLTNKSKIKYFSSFPLQIFL
jgi:hypothetical protein